MPKKKKVEAVEEQPVTTVQVATSTGFRLKITNMKKSAFPDPLIETDYLKIKVGDYMKRSTTIYEVIALSRDKADPDVVKRLEQQNTRYANPSTGRTHSDPKLKELMDKYEANAGYGYCHLTIRPVIRAEKEIAKGRITIVNELTLTGMYTHVNNTFRPTDLEKVVAWKKSVILSYERQMDKAKAKRDKEIETAYVIQKLIQSKNPSYVVDAKPTPQAGLPFEELCPGCENEKSKEQHPCAWNVLIDGATADLCDCCATCAAECRAGAEQQLAENLKKP